MARGHRSKIKRERNSEKDSRARASVTNAPVSDTKARVVLRAIKDKSVAEAMGILKMSSNKAAGIVAKVVRSAAANAEHNLGLDVSNLYVAEAVANQGSKKGRKRYKAGARGMAKPYVKRQSHINIILDER